MNVACCASKVDDIAVTLHMIRDDTSANERFTYLEGYTAIVPRQTIAFVQFASLQSEL